MGVASNLKEWSKIFAYGLCIGAADVVPGISGGTIALILGIYKPLIDSINSIQSGYKKISWGFLSAICSGVVTSLLFFSIYIDKSLNHPDYRTWLYSGFMGLVIASAYIISKRILIWHLKFIFAFLIGAVLAYFLTTIHLSEFSRETTFSVPISIEQIQNKQQSFANYDRQSQILKDVPSNALAGMISKKILNENTVVTRQSDRKQATAGEFAFSNTNRTVDPWLILCGIIAITAMLLPGVSGSYLLVILGAYPMVIGAVADVSTSLRHLHPDPEGIFILCNVGAGIALGGLIFARTVDWLLRNYHTATLATLLGFMLGTLPSLWPYHTYQYYLLPLHLEKGAQYQTLSPTLPDVASWGFFISVLCAFAGFLLAIGLDRKVDGKKRYRELNRVPVR